MKKLLLLFLLIPVSLFSQTKAEKEVIKMSVIADKANKTLELNWESRTNGTFNLFKRKNLTDNWGTPIKTFSFNETNYIDSNIVVGEGQEYHIVYSGNSGAFGHGYLYSGIEKEAQYNMNGILLIIDSNYAIPLQSEIDRLENDLFNEGWNVEKIYLKRSLLAFQVKSEITTKMALSGGNFDAIFIIGHITVPYSGDFKGAGPPPPDGHVEGSGNHTGAWAADVYYADKTGTWTDKTVTNTTGAQTRNHNKPNDGKFDQSTNPSTPDYQLGRVDMYDLPAFNKSDTLLLKQYLDRNHLWRTGQISTIKRGLIDNNFTSLNLASTGWANLTAMVHADSVNIRDYRTSQMGDSYLWSFGCGAGSYSSCRNVIKTSEFAQDSLMNIYTILSGSYFGDWDSKNNLLRSAIANSSLVSFWGGIPKWYIHTMGLGKNIGFGTKVSQGNTTEYFHGNFNGSANRIHIALMGDPSLTLNYFKGPTQLVASSSNSEVALTWKAAAGSTKGYFAYRFDTITNKFIQLNSSPIQTLSYTDKTNKYSGNIKYLVRAVNIETTPSGTYQNLGSGTNTSVNFIYENATSISESVLQNTFQVYPNPGQNRFTLTFSNDREDQIGIRIFDSAGKIHHEENVVTRVGLNKHQLNLDLTSGMYWLSISNGFEQMTQKLVVTSF